MNTLCKGCGENKLLRAKGLCGACFWGGMSVDRMAQMKAAIRETSAPLRPVAPVKASAWHGFDVLREGAL